jgi:hypothetical protein
MHRKFHEVTIIKSASLGMDGLEIEFRDKEGVVQTVASKGSFVILGRGGKKQLGPEALVPNAQANIEEDSTGLCDLLVQVLGMEGASLLDQETFLAVTPDMAANLNRMKGQVERIQHNLKALALLQEMQAHLADETMAKNWLTSVVFKVEFGGANEEGKAAAPLLLKVVKDMLPEIVARTIAYAEGGNQEAMADIGTLALTLKD